MPSFLRQLISRFSGKGRNDLNVDNSALKLANVAAVDSQPNTSTSSLETVPNIVDNTVPCNVSAETADNGTISDSLIDQNVVGAETQNLQKISPMKTLPVNLSSDNEAQPTCDVLINEEQQVTSEEAAVDSVENSTDQDRQNDIARAILVLSGLYGSSIAFNVTSSKWSERKSGIEAIQAKLEDVNQSCRSIDNFTSLSMVIALLITDIVSPNALAALDCFKTLMKVYEGVIDQSVSPALVHCLHALIRCMGSESACKRIPREACKCLLKVATHPSIDGQILIVPLILDPSINIKPRLSLARILIQEFGSGLKSKGLIATALNSLCLEGLQSADDKVRKLGKNLFVAAYSCYGKGLLRIISELKPSTAKMLQDKIIELENEENGDSTIEINPLMSQSTAKLSVSPTKMGRSLNALAVRSNSASLPMLKLNRSCDGREAFGVQGPGKSVGVDDDDENDDGQKM